MPRTLPWLKGQGASQARTRAPPVKRSRPLDSNSEASDHERSLRRAQAKQRRELAQQAGLSHDDIYIMVEDEFLSTAQLFTSHLHHAEYVRLKNAAKARSTTISAPISRPTDSITAMRAETKKKKEAELRSGRNRAALEKMKADARGKIAVTTSDEDSEEEEAEEAPWAGTSLQGLMAPAAKKNLTSLSGLQGIQSSTRAAKGYSKPDESQSRNRAENIFRSFAKPPKTVQTAEKTTTSNNHHRFSNISSSASSSDDLDALPLHSSKSHAQSHAPPLPHKKPPTKSDTNPLTLAAEDLFRSGARPKPNYSPPRKQQNNLLDSSPPSESDEVAAARRRLQQRRERAAAAAAAAKRGDEGMDDNVNVNEIPIFLV
ncbi:MAG: hypothetical protein Q9213_007035 [Squamulea squamosa]